MKRFTDAGRQAIQDGNLYAALSMALTLPDICASLEDPGPGKSEKRYKHWCEKWVEPKFTSEMPLIGSTLFVSAHDCYQLRCSLIHSGSAELEPTKQKIISRFEFFDHTAGAHLTMLQGNMVNGVLQPNCIQLKADLFSEEIFKAADEWDAATANNVDIQKEKAKLLMIRRRGDKIGSIQF